MLRGVQFEFMAAAHSGTQGDNGEVLHFEAVLGLVHVVLHRQRYVSEEVQFEVVPGDIQIPDRNEHLYRHEALCVNSR